MEKREVVDMITGDITLEYPVRQWFDAFAEYTYSPIYRRFLGKCYRQGMAVEQALEALKRDCAAKTYRERAEALQAREARAQAREARRSAPSGVGRAPGRPKVLLTASDVQARIRAVLLKELAALELRELDAGAKVLVDATKRQVLGA